MVTPDMEATVRFYDEILGMPLIGTLGNGDPHEPYPFRHYFFSLGGRSTLAFFEWPDIDTGTPRPAGLPHAGSVYDHVSFNLETVADLVALRARLVEHGIEVSDIVDHTVFHSIYFTDPINGASLEASAWIRDLHTNPYWGDPEPGPATAAIVRRSTRCRPCCPETQDRPSGERTSGRSRASRRADRQARLKCRCPAARSSPTRRRPSRARSRAGRSRCRSSVKVVVAAARAVRGRPRQHDVEDRAPSMSTVSAAGVLRQNR